MSWHFRDLTAATNAPAAITGPCTYVFTNEHTQHVDYVGSDGNIHELWWDATGWHHNDLTNRTGVASLSGARRENGPSGYIFAGQGTQHVVFIGEESIDGGHVHELWWQNGAWHHHDLTDSTDAPLAVPVPPGAYTFDWQGSQHVDYVGNDGHIHELWWDEDGWHHHDLTKAAGAPTASQLSPAGYALSNAKTQHVNYLGTDGFVHELKWKSGDWKHTNLNTITGAPASRGPPSAYAYAIGGTGHVNYIGVDGHVHELWFDGTWHWDDLAVASDAAPGDGVLCAYPFNVICTRHVAYTNASGRIHHLWWGAGVWHHEDLSNTGAPLADFAPLSGYAFDSQRTQHVIYVEIQGLHICELWWQDREIPIAEIPRTAMTG